MTETHTAHVATAVGRDNDNKTQKVASTDLKFSFPGADDWQREEEQRPSGVLATAFTSAQQSRVGPGAVAALRNPENGDVFDTRAFLLSGCLDGKDLGHYIAWRTSERLARHLRWRRAAAEWRPPFCCAERRMIHMSNWNAMKELG